MIKTILQQKINNQSREVNELNTFYSICEKVYCYVTNLWLHFC